nr:unnamed protein product [Callosobruchus analis]
MGAIVEHNSPMLLMDHLPKLLASSLPDSQIAKNINCARTKTTQIIHMLKNYAESSVVEKLRNQFFSIIIDETTDISSKKCLAILVRFLDASKDKIKDTLLALVEVENCTAGGLTQAIVDLLEKFEINKNNVIGFAADNASVMMGQFGGVQAKLKELVNPDIFVLGCICHSLHLCASEACKKIPSEAEEFVQDIYNYICRSPKRLKVYEEFQAFIDLKPHKLLRLSQTRWLSLEAVVKRILEKWQALKLYFTSEVIEEKDFMRPRQILDKFERPETEIYLSFLCYILPLINKLNLEFQSEKPKIHILFERIMTLYKTILKCFLKNNYVDRAKSINDINPLNVYEYLKNEEIYLGQQAESVLTKYNLRKDDVRDILNNCLKFYVELCLQIRNRFKNLSQYENFQLLNPNTVLERPTSITILIQQFKHFVKDNMEEIASECREISSLPNQIKIKLKELEFSAFWFELSSFKNSADQKVFGNIYQFVFNIMCLPHSSACAERIFSQLNLIKTKQRNRLLPETCNSLLMAKTLLDSNPCFVWAPETALLNEQIIYTSSKNK